MTDPEVMPDEMIEICGTTACCLGAAADHEYWCYLINGSVGDKIFDVRKPMLREWIRRK